MSVVEAPERVVAPSVTDADVLERAADLLGEFGWCQNRMGSKTEGHFCMMGAVAEATFDVGAPDYRYFDLVEGLWEHGCVRHEGAKHPVAAWNDSPLRTKAEVVARLREAAARARSAA